MVGYSVCYRMRNIRVLSILEGEECSGSQYATRRGMVG